MIYKSFLIFNIVFIFVTYLVTCSVDGAQWNEIEISYSDLENVTQNDPKTKTTYYHLRNWYNVSSEFPVTIKFTFEISYLNCYSHFERTPFRVYKNRDFRNKFTIEKGYKNGIWCCEIQLADQNRRNMMFLKVHLMDVKPPQMLFVNRIALQTELVTFKHHTATYYYEEGDALDVACYIPDDNCKIQMEFQTALNQPLLDQKEMWGASLRYKFQAVDNGSSIICTYRCQDTNNMDKTDLKVTFVQKSQTTQYVNVTINGLEIKIRSNIINIYNYFLNEESLTIIGDVLEKKNSEKYKVTVNYDYCEPEQHETENGVSLKIKPHEILKLEFVARGNDNPNRNVLERVVIAFTPINTYNTSLLAVNLAEENVKLSFYEYEYWGTRSKSYYNIYNYCAGDTFHMNCTSTVPLSSSQIIKIDGKAQQKITTVDSYNKYVPLGTADSETRWNCTLEETNPYNKLIGFIEVRFFPKCGRIASTIKPKPGTPSPTTLATNSPTTSTEPPRTIKTTTQKTEIETSTKISAQTGDDSDYMKWVIVGASIVVVMCVICVFIVIYKMKRRDCPKSQTNGNYDNMKNGNGTVSHSHPVQCESDCTDPEGEMYDNSLYEGYGPTYSKPIPKHLRKGKMNLTAKKYDEPCALYTSSSYASLDLGPQTQGKSTYISQGTSAIYSEIVPQNPKFINIDDRDYVEPAYCESRR